MPNSLNQHQAKELWDYWYPLVYAYFYKRLNLQQDVEDLTAEVVSIFLMKDHSQINNPKAYVWQIAKNQLYSYYAAKKAAVSHQELTEHTAIFDVSFEEFETQYSQNFLSHRQRLLDCINKTLKEDEGKIVRASLIDEMNSTQISKLFDIKANTVRQKIKRATEKLKKNCLQIWNNLSTTN